MHRTHYFVLSALLIAGILSACGSSEGQATGREANGPMEVKVEVLRPQPFANTIRATGSLLANEAVEVRSEVTGRVTEIGFREGGKVAKGQVLVRINDDDFQAQLRKTDLAVQLASDDEGRKKQLLDVKGISQQAYDDAQIALQTAQAERANLQAQLAKTVIRAPFSGKIGLRQVSEGDYVSPNTLIADLQQVSPIKVDFTVPGRYANALTAGKEITFTVDGDTTNYTAEIYAVSPSVDVASRTIRIRAKQPNRDGHLLPGSFAHIKVDLASVPDALMIPAEALIPDIQGQKVLLIRNGKAESVRVQTGIRTDDQVQLTAGVQPGDTVITSGLLQLRDGMEVRAAAPEAAHALNETDSSTTEQ